MRLVLAATLFAAALAQRESKEGDVDVHDSAVSSWLRGEQPPVDHLVALTVVVRIDEDRREALERIFWEVSDPKHANYGKYRSRDEITELLGVPQSRVERVQDYFAGRGMSLTVSPNRDMISVTGPVMAVEAALETTLHFFTHKERSGVQIVRASQGYSLPAELSRDVVMVGDLLQFPHIKSKLFSGLGDGHWPNMCEAKACKGLVTPAVLSARYRYPNASADDEAVAGNSMAVAAFEGEYWKTTDLTRFQSSCGVPNIAVDTIMGGNNESAGVSSGESELDIEYIKAVAPSVPLTVVYSEQFSLLDWANRITSLADPPLVHSVSYGQDEIQQSSAAFMFSVNTAFMKAGVQGLSLLVSSGDQGVCGRTGCGGIFDPAAKRRFKPDFPAASPYITAVGGTEFLGTAVGDEQAWQSSGGGFSDTFEIPAYQQEAVASYMARSDANLPDQRFWNATGRGYPDVSALGGQKNPYCVSTSNAAAGFGGMAGTSASSPVVAGIFARLNGLRLAAGKPALGFLNPLIYQNPAAFFDVRAGVNRDYSKHGFTAVEGWDAATGHGTPNYDALAVAVMEAVQEVVV